MNRITLKRVGIAYAIFLGAVYLFDKSFQPLSSQGLQTELALFDMFNFIFFSLSLFPATLWTIGHFNKLAAHNKNRPYISLELITRFNRLFCWSAAAWCWINLLVSHFHSVFRQQPHFSTGDAFMTQFSPNPVILTLQCVFLVSVILLAVLFSAAFIRDIDDVLPSVIPRRLRLPVWFAAVLLVWRFAPDIFPPVLEFIHIQLNSLTRLAADTFKIEPFAACFASLCLGLLLGSFSVAASFLNVLERYRKGMFEELDELIARCPCRPEENAAS